MRELVLMRRDSEEMNVPSEKVQEYLEAGWVEISRRPMDAPVAVETPPASAPFLQESDDGENLPAPKGKMPKGKGS